MEHLPSDEQHPPSRSFEREKEPPSPSFLRRAVRSLLTPILLGGAVAATTFPLPAEGGDLSTKEEQKAEDPNLTKLRQEIPSLITDLNHSHFRHREQAQRRLREITTEWVTTKQKPFPLLSLLQQKDEYSSEQRRRLERILAAHEHEELQLLWRPTMINIPPQWQGRDHPMLTDVLRELSSQTGYYLVQSRLPTQQELQSRKIAFPTGESKTFWEVGTVVRDTLGSVGWEIRSDSALQYGVPHSRNQWACPKGAAMGMLHALYDSEKNEENVALSVTLEPKLICGNVAVEQWEVLGENGNKAVVREPAQQSRMLVGIKLPSIPKARKALLSVTATITAHEPVTVPIAHLKKGQDIMKTPSFTLQFQGVQETPERQINQRPMVWRVQVISPEEYAIVAPQMHLIRCRAFSAKGQLILARSAQWQHQWALAFQWEFWEEPSHIEFVVPGHTTTKTETFTFADVPLPH